MSEARVETFAYRHEWHSAMDWMRDSDDDMPSWWPEDWYDSGALVVVIGSLAFYYDGAEILIGYVGPQGGSNDC